MVDQTPPYFSAELVHLDGCAVIVLLGELDMATAPTLQLVLDPFIDAGPDELFFDFSNLTFIDSSGLAVLTIAQNRLTTEGRRLIVRSPRSNAARVMEIAGLTAFLNVDSNYKAPIPEDTEEPGAEATSSPA